MNINCDILDLRAFIAVMELGHFNRAADALAMSQPALSRRIQKLEQTIGAQLFNRTTRNVEPTAVGREMLPLVRRLIDEFDQSLFSFRDVGLRRGGLVTMACLPTAAFYFLPAVIKRFRLEFPNIRFRIMDLSANDGLAAVSRGEVEFGINLMGASSSELQFTPLCEDPFVLATHREHPLATLPLVRWSDLEGHALITVGRTSGNRTLLDSALARANVHIHWTYETTHLSTSLGLVEAGIGVSVLPRMATPPDEHPIIVVRPLTDPSVTRTIGIVRRRGTTLSPTAQRFVDMLVSEWQQPREAVGEAVQGQWREPTACLCSAFMAAIVGALRLGCEGLFLRLMCLNGWGGKLHDLLIPYLKASDPDVLCLQEVVHTPTADRTWLTYWHDGVELPQRANFFLEVCRALPDHVAVFCPAAQGDLWDGETRYDSQWGLATFVRKSIPIIGQKQGFVHGEFSANGYGDHPRPRSAHAVRLFDFDKGHPVVIAHVHGLRDLDGKHDTAARLVQARRLADLVQSVTQDGDRMIVCGDFNVLPESGTFDILRAIGLADLVTTRGFEGTRTSHYQKSGRYADYMLVNAAVNVVSFDVIGEPEVSDHCPLVLDFD